MHRAFCFYFTAARQGSSMASVPVFCRDFWAERKKPGRGRTIWNVRRVRFAHIQRKNYFYFRASGASADAPLAHFHEEGS